MFFQGERGRFVGFYALAVTNGVSELLYNFMNYGGNANQPHLKASFWPYRRWLYFTKYGMEMDFLCEQHGIALRH